MMYFAAFSPRQVANYAPLLMGYFLVKKWLLQRVRSLLSNLGPDLIWAPPPNFLLFWTDLCKIITRHSHENALHSIKFLSTFNYYNFCQRYWPKIIRNINFLIRHRITFIYCSISQNDWSICICCYQTKKGL